MNDIPFLGVGLSYRSNIHNQIVRSRHGIDFLELIPDQFIYSNNLTVESVLSDLADFPFVSHSVNLSIGTAGEIDEIYLDKIIEFINRTNSICYSDHLCFTRIPGVDLGHLTPIQFTEEMVKIVSHNIATVHKKLKKIPFLLENIVYYLDLPGADLSEAEFISKVISENRCDLLLDINNLYVNSVNRKYDPIHFLEQIPLDKVKIIHIAGHRANNKLLLDSHDRPLAPAVWDILEYVATRSPIKAIVLEQDDNFADFELLLEQLDKARTILRTYRKENV